MLPMRKSLVGDDRLQTTQSRPSQFAVVSAFEGEATNKRRIYWPIDYLLDEGVALTCS